jgi:hypothetical protein
MFDKRQNNGYCNGYFLPYLQQHHQLPIWMENPLIPHINKNLKLKKKKKIKEKHPVPEQETKKSVTSNH